MSPKRFF